jgi:catechol 1,2-dioxygenase
MVESPRRELGDSIDFVGTGTPCVVRGRVLSADGSPLPGAELDVWQASDQGFYDVQQPDVQPRANGRGLFTADAAGPSGSARSCRATIRYRPTARLARC